MDAPDALHPRTESSSGSLASRPRVKRSVPWFDDGNIILEAEQTQFRINRRILSEHSVIFKDMFDLSQPDGEGEVEGCPVVHLSDRAEEVQHVLDALHHSNQYGLTHYLQAISLTISCSNICRLGSHGFSDKTPLPLSLISSFLRLGRKYGIDQLHAEAVAKLSVDFPSTLQGYDKCMKTAWPQAVDLKGCSLFTVIDLARENDVQSILPCVLYVLCQFAHHNSTPFVDSVSRVILAADDIKACVKAHSELLRLQLTKTFGRLDVKPSPSNPCTHLLCAMTKKAVFYTYYYLSAPLCPFALWNSRWGNGLCSDCIIKSRQLREQGRAAIWGQLPALFGLPGWDELLME
jgi:hypothetical protein